MVETMQNRRAHPGKRVEGEEERVKICLKTDFLKRHTGYKEIRCITDVNERIQRFKADAAMGQ